MAKISNSRRSTVIIVAAVAITLVVGAVITCMFFAPISAKPIIDAGASLIGSILIQTGLSLRKTGRPRSTSNNTGSWFGSLTRSPSRFFSSKAPKESHVHVHVLMDAPS